MAKKKNNPADPSPEQPPAEADARVADGDVGETAEAMASPGETEEQASAPQSHAEEEHNGEMASTEGNDSLGDMLSVNFLEYASYVIKERAIPDVVDGMKPVQRRILHSLWEMDDGRFHKVANVIGHTMRYHPHGDASIGNALVVLANKDYFIDRQGNFGNIFTGDEASAARYIECRLTPLAREVLFNRELTEFVDSYDGRNKEPVIFPAKVPALLMMGSDGIAVGMATRIMPHNFAELLKAQIAILKGRKARVYPDFLTGGLMDAGEYEDGNGRLIVRARIDIVDDKTLVIKEVPATVTTEKLMMSIIRSSERGKIKIASVNDYTADEVEIEIKLPRGHYAKDCVKQLYAYTDCEVSISCNLTVIRNNRPECMTVTQILKDSTEQLVDILRRELELELGKLEDRFHEKTLAQIFIENRIYKRIEDCPTYEKVIAEVHAGLEPFKDQLKREVTDEDVEKLLAIQIRRISLFDINRNRQELDAILEQIEQVKHNLNHLRDYAIDYVKGLLKKYGSQYPRRTKIEDLETISAREVALSNVRVGHDRVNHFVGSDVRNSNKNEDVLTCTEFDRLVLLKNTGEFKVVPIPDKLYVGPVKYVFIADKKQVYSMIYRHKKTGRHYAKRFAISRYIMDKEYKTIPKGCIIENIYTNYGVVLNCEFKHKVAGADDAMDLNFDEIQIRSSQARGFKISDRPLANFNLLKRGSQEPGGEEEPDPETVGKENADGPDGEAAEQSGKGDGTAESEVRETVYEPHQDPDLKLLGEEDLNAPDGKADKKDTGSGNEPQKPTAKAGKGKKARKAPAGNVAEESKKTRLPATETPKPKDDSSVKQDPDPVADLAEDKKPTEKKPSASTRTRKVIDEETPFFLE